MKKGWTYKKLGEVCDILDYMRKPITKGKRESGDIPYYGATGCLDYVKYYIFDEKLVLLGEDGAKWGAGETSSYIIEGKSWVNNHAHALRPRREILLDEILVYYLNYSNLLPFITGVTVPKLNQEKMRSIDIPIAPIKEQKRIVERLDVAFAQIDELKANAEKQLAEARALFQKSLAKAMEPKEGWEEKKLGQVCEITSSKRIFKNEYTECGVPFYRTKELKELAHNHPISLELFISNSKYLEIKEKFGVPAIGDILISAVGTIGETLIIKDDSPFYFKDGNIVWLRKIQGVDSLFLKIALDSIVNNLKAVTRGAAYNALTIEKLKQIDFSFPKSLSEQQRIVERLDSISENVRKYEEIQQKIIAECDALKQALLRQVFE